jgi:uncharacterized protein YhjY with autotransporter beta-barrel domain
MSLAVQQKHMIGVQRTAVLAFCIIATPPAIADLNGFEGTPLEVAAARANQATFDALRDPTVTGRDVPRPGLDTEQIAVFEHVRTLVHTANEIQGSGPTTFSLGLDNDRLGFALRWTAAEEIAAQGSLASEIGKGQLSYLANRLSTLRAGTDSSGLARFAATADYPGHASVFSAATTNATTTPDFEVGGTFSRLNGFVNGSFGSGDKAATALEDAFDFTGTDIVVGIDYRLRDSIFVGSMAGFSTAAVEFDSSQSIVDGSIDTQAYSLSAYALYVTDTLYLDVSLSASAIGYDIIRDIRYPSFNPNVASVDETAVSRTDGVQTALSIGFGHTGVSGPFSWEPFVRLNATDTSIDGFNETNTRAGAFDLSVNAQSVTSLSGSAGLQLAYTLSQRQRVIIPFLRVSLHREFNDVSRKVAAVYQNGEAATFGSDQDFQLATDPPDTTYTIAAAGFSSVIRGSQLFGEGETARGGLQIFAQFETVQGLANISNNTLTGGLRYEF